MVLNNLNNHNQQLHQQNKKGLVTDTLIQKIKYKQIKSNPQYNQYNHHEPEWNFPMRNQTILVITVAVTEKYSKPRLKPQSHSGPASKN